MVLKSISQAWKNIFITATSISAPFLKNFLYNIFASLFQPLVAKISPLLRRSFLWHPCCSPALRRCPSCLRPMRSSSSSAPGSLLPSGLPIPAAGVTPTSKKMRLLWRCQRRWSAPRSARTRFSRRRRRRDCALTTCRESEKTITS